MYTVNVFYSVGIRTLHEYSMATSDEEFRLTADVSYCNMIAPVIFYF